MRYKTVGVYSSLAYLNQGCNVVINLMFIKMLPLGVLGEIAIAKVWMQLMDYSHLGFRFALDRYGPVWEKERSENLLWLCVIVSSAVSSLVICIALMFSSNPLLMAAFVAWGYCVAIATIFKNYYRAIANNKKMLYIYAICPTVPVFIQTLAVVFLGFFWFLMLTISIYVCALFFLFRGTDVRKSLKKLDIVGTVSTVRSSAVSLLLSSIIIFMSFSIDRILLNNFATKEILGEYSVIMFGFSLLLIIPSTLAEFVFPKIVSETVRTGRIFFPKEMLSIFVPTIIVVGISFLVAPVAVEMLTNYSRLVGMIQFITIGIIPYAITPVLFHVMNALDMRHQLVVAACLVLGLYTSFLIWGALYSDNVLQYFTVARAAYGYLLALVYCGLLVTYRARQETRGG